ncbi:T-complex protein 1 subunit gamma [Tanacetum coccineum]
MISLRYRIMVTNDGNAILRELDIAHPSMIELSRTQDEEVGDRTTSIILTFKFPTGEMLHVAKAFIDKKYHPTVICRAYVNALEDALVVLNKISMFIDVNDREFYDVGSGEELFRYKVYQSVW